MNEADKKFVDRLTFGGLAGLAALVATIGYFEPPPEERRRLEAEWVAKQVAGVAENNRVMMCGAIAFGWPLDSPPYVREVYQGRYTAPIGHNSMGATHDDPIPLKDVYGFPRSCEDGLTPSDVTDVCGDIGLQITTAQISASLAGSSEEVRKALDCLE